MRYDMLALPRHARDEVVLDTWLGGPEGHSDDAARFVQGCLDRKALVRDEVGVGPSGSADLETGLTGRCEQHRSRGELAAVCRVFAQHLEQLFTTVRPHDRLVGGAQCREHPNVSILLFFAQKTLEP